MIAQHSWFELKEYLVMKQKMYYSASGDNFYWAYMSRNEDDYIVCDAGDFVNRKNQKFDISDRDQLGDNFYYKWSL